MDSANDQPVDQQTTLEALVGSIAKWQGIVDGTARDNGGANCPLCKVFNPSDGYSRFCRGCPVFQHTGKPYCDKTPYASWRSVLGYIETNLVGGYIHTKDTLSIARAELDFLKSLLPGNSIGTIIPASASNANIVGQWQYNTNKDEDAVCGDVTLPPQLRAQVDALAHQLGVSPDIFRKLFTQVIVGYNDLLNR